MLLPLNYVQVRQELIYSFFPFHFWKFSLEMLKKMHLFIYSFLKKDKWLWCPNGVEQWAFAQVKWWVFKLKRIEMPNFQTDDRYYACHFSTNFISSRKRKYATKNVSSSSQFHATQTKRVLNLISYFSFLILHFWFLISRFSMRKVPTI